MHTESIERLLISPHQHLYRLVIRLLLYIGTILNHQSLLLIPSILHDARVHDLFDQFKKNLFELIDSPQNDCYNGNIL